MAGRSDEDILDLSARFPGALSRLGVLPDYPDPETADKARFLNQLGLLFGASLTVLMLAYMVAAPEATTLWFLILLTSDIASAGLLIGIRRWRVRASGMMFFTAIWLTATLLAWLSGGLDAPALGLQYMLVVLISVVMGRRPGLIALGICLLTMAGLAAAEALRLVPAEPISHTPASRAVEMMFFVGGVGLMLSYFAELLRRSMRSAREESEKRVVADSTLEIVNAQLAERELLYRRLVEDAPDAIFVHSQGTLVYANRAAALMVGASGPDEVLGKPVMGFVHPDNMPSVAGRVKMMLETNTRAPLMLERYVRLDGTSFYAETIASPLVYDGKPAIQVIMREQTERSATEDELQFRSFLLDNVLDGIIVRDAADFCVLYVNQAMCDVAHRTREQFFATSECDWVPSDERDAIKRHFESVLRHGSGSIETVADLENGARTPVEVRTSVVTYLGRRAVLSVVSDISERKSAQQTIEHMALHDVLTGLANRALMMDRLEVAIAHVHRTGEPLTLFFLDVDHFKAINDSVGHGIGDMLLAAVAERLVDSVREDDTVARLGGDEFTMLLPGVGSIDEAQRIGDKILTQMRRPFSAGDQDLSITASLGIAIYDDDSLTAEDLLRNADLAMYTAKEDGRDAQRVYDRRMNENAVERYVLKNDLKDAVVRGEIALHYQPIVRLADGTILGAEALCRWQHPVYGTIPPTVFIPLAEESGAICDLGEWVVREACAEAQAWTEAGGDGLVISINLSPRQLYNGDLTDIIRSTLTDCGLDPHRLELELTETTAMRDASHLALAFRKLRAMGVRIAVDDFGTGYSSLDYLRQLPVDVLKVDRSFVRDVCEDESCQAIASAIVSLGQALRLQVIAEGVETEEQRRALIDARCEQAQGFLFSPAVPSAEFRQLISGRGGRLDVGLLEPA